MQWIKADKQFPNSSGYYFVKDLGDMKRVLWFDKRIFDQEGDNSVCWTDGINKYAGYELIEWLSQSSPPCQCERYREVLEKIIQLKESASDTQGLFPLLQYINVAKALLADGGKEGDGKPQPEAGIREIVSDIIFEAAISKAIEDKRELLRPSIQHFLKGGNVNGQFDLAIKKLMRWVENKTIEAIPAAPQTKPVK